LELKRGRILCIWVKTTMQKMGGADCAAAAPLKASPPPRQL
jgi:hypothetical protein